MIPSKRRLGMLGVLVVAVVGLAPAAAVAPVSAEVALQTASDAALTARGAVQIPAQGTIVLSRTYHNCPDGKPGCSTEVSAGSTAQTTTINGQTVLLAGSGTYWVDWTERNIFGQSVWREFMNSALWWNGSGAGQYWVNHQAYVYMPFWAEQSCLDCGVGGFWDGGQWAWTNWANTHMQATVGVGPINGVARDTYPRLRMWTQPNGHHWFWSSA